ncbi:MAG TPA: hypothetical protein PKN30_08770 [Flavobacteriales bacterium]|nr:hypothetical protein [Flavobacteriales bacterium]
MNVDLTYTEPQAEIFFGDVRRFNSVAKGRRFGATRGAAHACIEWSLEGMPILWGDTIAGNVERYWERYFLPATSKNNIDAHLSSKNVGKIGSGYIDFRSADRPENWEGFGYKKIVLNEAGIIFSDPYLYTNAVLPMMMDYPDAELFALGAPKGKRLKNGKAHPFYQLYTTTDDQHRSLCYSTYDNPFLSRQDIEDTENEIMGMDPEQVKQEIYGQFIDRSAGNPFAFAFDKAKHVKPCDRRPNDFHYFSIDFNVDPFSAIVSHTWQDQRGHHAHTFGAAKIKEASINAMGEWIESVCPQRHLIRITGDRGGMSRSIGTAGPIRMFTELRKRLRISEAQLQVPPNPTHLRSREDYNYVLASHPDYRIDPSCTRLIGDHLTVEVDSHGKIIKSDRTKASQQADELDCSRYFVNTYLRGWMEQNKRRA